MSLCHCSEKVRQGGAKKGGILPLFLKVEPRQCHHRFHVIYGLGPGYLCDCSHLVPATSHRQRVPWLCRWRKNWLASVTEPGNLGWALAPGCISKLVLPGASAHPCH